MNTAAPLPAPLLPDTGDMAALASYGAGLLQALAEREPVLPAAAGQGLVQALADIALALQAGDSARLRGQHGWWGRLLGRDIEREAQAQALQSRLGVVALQAQQQAQRVRAQAASRQRAIDGAQAAAAALLAWSDAGAGCLPRLPQAAQDTLSVRLDHLRRLAALRQQEAGQWQLLQAQEQALLARFQRIHEVLLPAWRQAVLARQAQQQGDLSARAAALQAQIRDEVAAAQARLP